MPCDCVAPRSLPQSTVLTTLTPATARAYAYGQRVFAAWCAARGHPASPVDLEVLLVFLKWGSQRWRRSTMTVFVGAIAHHQRHCGVDLDTGLLYFFLRGFHSGQAVLSDRAAALDADTLRTILDLLPNTLAGLRDRALLLLGFAAALRPGELVGLEIGTPSALASGTLTIARDGMQIVLNGRKSAQRGTLSIKHVPRSGEPCAVAATERWLTVAGITHGPLFRIVTRSGGVGASRLATATLTRILRRRVHDAWLRQGLSEAQIHTRLSAIKGYSLRSGFVTAAVANNVDGKLLARHLGWSTPYMAVRYNRPGPSGDVTLVEQVLSHLEEAHVD